MYWKNITILFIFVAFILLGIKFFNRKPDNTQFLNTKSIIVNTVTSKYIKTPDVITSSAFIENESSNKITAQVSGRVNKIYIHDNQSVKQYDTLIEIGAVKAQNIMHAAHKKYQETQKKYDRALEMQKNNYIAKAEFESLEANLTNSKIEYQNSKIDYDKSMVKAPNQGIVKLAVKLYDVVNISDTLAHIDFADNKIANLNLAKKYFLQIRPGQKIIAYDDNNNEYQGHIGVVDNALNSATQTFNVKVKFDNIYQNNMIVGSYIKIHIFANELNVIKLPQDAVIRYDNKYYVYIIENNKSHKIPVILVQEDEAYSYIQNVAENVKIITSGHIKLLDGQEVTDIDEVKNSDNQNM